MLIGRRATLERMAERLLEREKLEEVDIVEILGPRPVQA
jgi:ATP-dependent Zn protease